MEGDLVTTSYISCTFMYLKHSYYHRHIYSYRVSSKKFYQGGSSVLTTKGGHDKKKRGVVSILNLDIVRGWLKSLGGEVGELRGEAPPPPPTPSR